LGFIGTNGLLLLLLRLGFIFRFPLHLYFTICRLKGGLNSVKL
jgi:hypothetical protein